MLRLLVFTSTSRIRITDSRSFTTAKRPPARSRRRIGPIRCPHEATHAHVQWFAAMFAPWDKVDFSDLAARSNHYLEWNSVTAGGASKILIGVTECFREARPV